MRSKTTDIAFIGIFVAIITVCAWISIPTVVPFTLQTLGVYMAISLLGGRRGTIATIVYILLGAVGLPVFSGFYGGISAIIGPTGGYIIGFIFIGLIMWAFEKWLPHKPWAHILSMVTGLIACYILGTVWFMIVYAKSDGPVGFVTVLSWCVIPFIIPDAAKIALAYVLSNRLKRFIPQEAHK